MQTLEFWAFDWPKEGSLNTNAPYMGSDPEKELLARCCRGDSDAWDELFDLHYSAAGRFVFQLGPGLALEDVQEICQETFLSVIKSLSSFKGGSRFQTWLFRIAANKTRDFIERQRAAKRGGGQVPVSLQTEDPESGLTLDPPSKHPGPDDIAMSQEKMLLVRQALDSLGEPCREILELRYFGDLSYDEIALALKLNPKTVSSRLSKCLDRFEALARTLSSRENSTPFSV
ncbi:MAG: RNA polymerase sigma factor [Verrucomicrobia bacterium]|nr:RNA polymerase sigma factor [Verrucomicrobiota bacterium]